MKKIESRGFAVLAGLFCLAVCAVTLVGCGGSGSASTKTQTNNSTQNVQAISVAAGPAGTRSVDTAFTSVTVCIPGSSQCQTISEVLVDTGSSGLRILSSALTLSLPQQKDSNGNPVVECAQFADGETWGPVQTADITIAGEQASSVPIQVVGTSGFAVPTACSNLGPTEETTATLGANGILGVGNFVQDCGLACTQSGGSNAGFYYSCPSGGCQVTAQALSQQVSNPVAFFQSDNNGVVIELPAVSSAELSVNGSMIFGIGTQSNNGLGSATVYTLASNGNISTTLNGHTYTDAAFLDSGSNAIYFLDSSATGMSTCTDLKFLYCPSSTQNFSAMNIGANGASGTVNFAIENGDTLVSNAANAAVPNLGGPNPGAIDWGMPFFFGRSVFVAIEGRSTPGGTGPFVAY